MNKHTILLLLIAAAFPAFADDQDTGLRLWQDNRQAERIQERKVREADEAARRAQAAEEGSFQDTGAALYHAVNAGDWKAVRTLLTQYRSEAGHDADIALFAQAALAHADKRWKQARRDYETLLQRRPDFTRGRLDLARLLYENRLNREARAQFALAAQDPELPESVRSNISGFQTALDRRESWRGSIQTGAVWNSNVNESGGGSWCVQEADGECLAQWTANRPESAQGIKYEATAERSRQLSGHHGVFARGTAYGRIYRNQQPHNQHTVNLSAGYKFENARHSLALAPVWEWSSSGNATESRSYGLRGEWEQNIGRWSIDNEIEWKKLDYAQRYLNFDGHMLSANSTFSYTPRPDILLYGGLGWQKRHTPVDTDAYRQATLRAGIAKSFPQRFYVSASAIVRHRSYEGHNALLQQRRRDTEQTYLLNIGAERWQFAGITPVIEFKHRRVNSNIDWLYSYRQNEIGLSLQKTF